MRHLLTGAGSGIGHALARLLHDRGDDLVLIARSADRATAIAADLPQAEVLVGDLAEPGTLHGLGREVAGPLDSLVHCAGGVTLAPLATARLDDWHRQLDVNLVAPAVLTREFVPHLRQSRGTVVFVNSTAGLQVSGGWAAYGASKFGLRAVADALREEEPRLRVCSVYPSRTASPMQERVRAAEGVAYAEGDYMSADSVARAIVDVIDQPADITLTDLTLRTRRVE